MNKHYRIW